MIPESNFKNRLDAVVREIVPAGRTQVEALIASVLKAGGGSEHALIEMSEDKSLDPQFRADICWLIPRLKMASAAKVLKALISDSSEPIRVEAANGLGLVPGDDAVEILVSVLENDRSKSVRLAALHSLGIRSSARSAASVMRILLRLQEDPEVRADAAEALAHVKDKRVVGVLTRSLRDKSPLVRYSAAYALGEQGDPRAIPTLRKIAAHDHAVTPWGSVASRAIDAVQAITDRNS